jgi:hypothetical protein
VPDVNPGESEKSFVARAIPILLKDGTAKDQAQAAAIAYSMFRKHNKKKAKPAAAAANAAALKGPFAALRAPTAYSDSGVSVDFDNGIIKNVALITEGIALGKPFDIDKTTVEQIVALVNASADGIKCRFRHPNVKTSTDPEGNVIQEVADDTGTMVGRIKNGRIATVMQDGKPVAQGRGDVFLGDYASAVPGMGDVRGYLLNFANEDAAGIGLSAFFPYTVEPILDNWGAILSNPARPVGLEALDFVGKPASNPRGLLSASAVLYDPQPPSGAPNSSGWQEPKPADKAKAPIPAGTPDPPSSDAGRPPRPAAPPEAPVFPHDTRGAYLGHIVKHGMQTMGSLASRFNGRLEAMRAGCEWLADNGYAKRVMAHGGRSTGYEATPKGKTAMAANGIWPSPGDPVQAQSTPRK